MFENEFFPTPVPVIDKMIRPFVVEAEGMYGFRRRAVLDPSAGKGDILDRLANCYQVERKHLSAIEIDPELRTLLRGKGYKVVDSDFLEHSGSYRFNLILMNPPFSNGVDHVLKAWGILYEGDIVCLLNAESTLNPYSEKRKLLTRLIEQHGSVEYIGRPFAAAEIKTDVEVCLIRLHKDAPQATVEFGERYERDMAVDEEAFAAAPLAHANIIEALVAQYNAAATIMGQQSELEKKYLFYVSGIKPYSKDEEKKLSQTLNERLDELKKDFWRYIFEKTRLGQVTTSDFQKRFYQFTEEQSRMAFSVRNVREVLEMFFLNRVTIMEECLLKVFDQVTALHEDNKIHTEGWKTNKSWKIARKMIVPYGVRYEYGSWNTWNSYHKDFLSDVDKVMCFLSGKDYDGIETIQGTMANHFKDLGGFGRRAMKRHDEYIYSTFFKIRMFKKGTVHLYFLDEQLWQKFNLAAAKGKNWIGQGY